MHIAEARARGCEASGVGLFVKWCSAAVAATPHALAADEA